MTHDARKPKGYRRDIPTYAPVACASVRLGLSAYLGNAKASHRFWSNGVQIQIVIDIRDRSRHAGVFGGFYGSKGAVHLFAKSVFQKD